MTIRIATADDAAAIGGLWREIDAGWEPSSEMKAGGFGALVPYDLESMCAFAASRIGDPSSCVLVAERDGDIVAALCMALLPFYFNTAKTMAYVVFFGVAPGHRGGGIGDGLLCAAMSEAKERGATVFAGVVPRLRTGAAASRGLYARLGFAELESTWVKELA